MEQKNRTKNLPLCWHVLGVGYFILGIFGVLNHPERLYWKMTFVFGIAWMVIVIKHLKEGKIPRKITGFDVFVFGGMLVGVLCGLVFAITNSFIMTVTAGISAALIIYVGYKKSKQK
jgi:hypothetical protein